MKKSLSISLLLTLPLQASDFSKTFFSVVPQFQAGSPEKEVLFRDTFTANTGRKAAVEVVAFGGKSRNGEHLGRYFLPFGKSEILVTEDGAADVAFRDVDAKHLNINHVDPGNTFQSRVSFEFHQSVVGLGLAFRSQVCSGDAVGWWLAASTPFVAVRNTAELCEKIENTGGTLEATRVATVKEAFAQSIWKFGRIDSGCSHHKMGFADIEVQVGYKWGEADDGHADLYAGVVIPTGNKPCGRFVFEPIVGNNQHFGILFGGTLAKEIYGTSKQSLFFVLSSNGRYLFHNTQCRSFDLKDKHWGRYMEVYENLAAAQAAFDAPTVEAGDHGSPGINVFTQKMRVSPGFAHQMNAAFMYKEKRLGSEVGYNLITRQAEKTCLRCWKEGPALVSAEGYPADGKTTKFRTISHTARGDEGAGTVAETYKPLTTADLDVSSAAHPAVVGHMLYGSFGYRFGDSPDAVPTAGIGGSYEFSSGNSYLDRWTLWAKISLMY